MAIAQVTVMVTVTDMAIINRLYATSGCC
jgi:hypothetical protein